LSLRVCVWSCRRGGQKQPKGKREKKGKSNTRSN
jgi:hypothetical protein